MKRLAVIAVVVAAGALIWRALPPHEESLATDAVGSQTVRGAYHIHTRRSDGTGTPEEIAAAASRAGLKFVILTDHDDASAPLVAPFYRQGVLVIDAVEISTNQGHVVALGLPRSPYPLGGEAADVIEDVSRLGGFSIAAHPGSLKPELRWVEWAAPFDGLEWLNGDSEWRDERTTALARGLLTYPFRSAETLAALLDRPDDVLRRWDALTTRRRVVALAGADAHARISLRSGEPDDRSPALHVPSYETMFHVFSISVAPVTLGGNAPTDARSIIEAIRAGHVYSSVDSLARPASVSFTATAGGKTFSAGDMIPASRDIELQVDSNAPADASIVLWRDGTVQAMTQGAMLRQTVSSDRAAYRVEIQLPRAPGTPAVPWVVTNPVYVGYETHPQLPARPPARAFAPQYENGPAKGWTLEMSPRSKAVLDVVGATSGTQLSMRWGLGGSLSESPYAALVMPAGPALSGYDRVMFVGRADHPMRLSVQLRVPGGTEGERWHRSVYLDDMARMITIFFDEMTPRGFTAQRRPNLSVVRDVLFVVDTVNTKPGASGQIWVDDVKYGR